MTEIVQTWKLLLCVREAKLARWHGYYRPLLNHPPDTHYDEHQDESKVETEYPDINLEMPLEAEYAHFVRALNNDKASGICRITQERLKGIRECVLI